MACAAKRHQAQAQPLRCIDACHLAGDGLPAIALPNPHIDKAVVALTSAPSGCRSSSSMRAVR